MKQKNQRLVKLREDACLTQEKLARKIGVSQSMIARIEAGERDPRTHVKIALARYFNVSIEWLFFEVFNNQQSYFKTGTEN